MSQSNLTTLIIDFHVIEPHSRRNFTLSYDTNIPRQVGLAGSSAIVTATLNCLMKFFNLNDNDLPKPKRASFILNVESTELFIQAGLQDRVIQVYEGLVYMDFDDKLFEKQGKKWILLKEIH